MKLRYLLILFALAVPHLAYAVPAYPWPQTVVQPDGTEITYRLQGDEYGSQMISTDGYLLTTAADGTICYADKLKDGSLKAVRAAHDIRSADERSFLMDRQHASTLVRKPLREHRRERSVSRDGFRGLVILVNYTNQKISVPNADVFYSEMINSSDYKGYVGQNGENVEFTGSVRDYFYDNSGGLFNPEFDIVGPVELNVPSTFPMQMQNAPQLISLALTAADPLVDFSKYDSDGDGRIDMVYFIFAGQGSNYTGGSEIWPHKSEIPGLEFDGVSTWTYACSAELSGTSGQVQIDGIGTICHEFSHVLGMVDEYDTDYQGTGGESDHPNTWSLMSMGCYLNYGRTPVGYSAYERIQAGFLDPEEITESGDYNLMAFETSGKAFKINSIVGDEFFILENRQPIKWDKALPGHGMLAYRVDRTDPELWSTNRVNRDPSHPCYVLLSAQPQIGGVFNTRQDTSYDPFPGQGNITELTNTTTPSLQSFYGYNSNVTLHEISENDGVISFRAQATPNETYSEIWSRLSTEIVGGAYAGSIASWSPSAGALIDRENSAVTFVKKSQITSSPIAGKVSLVKFTVTNPTNSSAIFQLKYSLNGGKTWTLAKTLAGDDRVTLEKGTSYTASYTFDEIDPDTKADLQLRILEFSGVTTQTCAIGDLEFHMVPAPNAGEGLVFMLPDMEYVVASDPEYPISFFYRGEGKIESVGYSWNAGAFSGEGTHLFKTPLDNGENSTEVAKISLDGIDTYGKYPVDMIVTSVNGNRLPTPIAAVESGVIQVIPFMPVKRPLVEEYTGLNCSACPKGYVFMETMRRDKKDMFVGMAYHSETFESKVVNGMAVLHNNEFPVIPRSIPSGTIDRKKVLSIEDMLSAWNNASSEIPVASVEVSLTNGQNDPETLHAVATSAFIMDMEDVDYAISIALVADNMKNSLWYQNNGFSGSSDPAYNSDLWQIFTKGDSYVAGLTFNDVVVSYPDIYGIEGSIPNTISAGESYEVSCDFHLPEIKNVYGQSFINEDARLRAVALVMDKSTGKILNCISSPYVDSSLGVVDMTEPETQEVECWNMSGIRINPDASGLQIRRIRYSDGTVKTIKLMNK